MEAYIGLDLVSACVSGRRYTPVGIGAMHALLDTNSEFIGGATYRNTTEHE
jgi:hypothetical protein